jgi:formate-dependent nitrite reductase membrane component NrfD
MEMIWGSIIAWYLFLAGLAAGAFIAAALAAFKNRDTHRIQLIGRSIALVALAVGLFLLMFDAEAGFKNPLRFFYLLTNFNSVMTWGVAILGVFGCISLITLILTILGKKVPSWLDGLGIAAAICTAAYTGVLIGVIKTYPLWNTALLPVLFLVSALSAGLAGTLAVSALVAHKELEKLGVLKKFHFALPPIELLLLATLLYVTSSSASAARLSVERLVFGDLSLIFWLGLVVVGLLIPLLLDYLSTFVLGRTKANSHISGGARALEVTSGASVLVGGFLLRYLIIVAAVPLTFVF